MKLELVWIVYAYCAVGGRVTVNDDPTGLTNMRVVAQGFYE